MVDTKVPLLHGEGFCPHDVVEPYGDGHYGRCAACGDDDFPITAEAAGMEDWPKKCATCGKDVSEERHTIRGIEGPRCSECNAKRGRRPVADLVAGILDDDRLTVYDLDPEEVRELARHIEAMDDDLVDAVEEVKGLKEEHQRRKDELNAQVLHVRLLRYCWDNERRNFDYDLWAELARKLLGPKSEKPWRLAEVLALRDQVGVEWEPPDRVDALERHLSVMCADRDEWRRKAEARKERLEELTAEPVKVCSTCGEDLGDSYVSDVPGVGDLCSGCHAERFASKKPREMPDWFAPALKEARWQDHVRSCGRRMNLRMATAHPRSRLDLRVTHRLYRKLKVNRG